MPTVLRIRHLLNKYLGKYAIFIIFLISLFLLVLVTTIDYSKYPVKHISYKYKPQLNWKPRNKPSDHISHLNLNTNSNGDKVLILTPLANFKKEYFDNVLQLSYPKDLINIGFIVPRTVEGDQALVDLELYLRSSSTEIAKYNKITILRQDNESIESQSEKERHKLSIQLQRRSSMAIARNSLLITTLDPLISWVLWLDADIIETPIDLIQDLVAHNKPVLSANCYQRYFNDDTNAMDIRPYDFNNWSESQEGLDLAASMLPDEIIVEGYSEIATWRPLMAYFYNKDESVKTLMPLDGVGGTCLMVKADVHRDGINFPSFPFHHLIETEGFAKMCKLMGYQVYGLPNYLVYHYNE